MRAHDLVRVRPKAQPKSYVGYSEIVAEYEIDYSLPGSYSEGQKVTDGARITGVTASRQYATSDSAFLAWSRAVSTVTPGIEGAKFECFRLVGGVTAGKIALWKSGRTQFSLSAYAEYNERIRGNDTRKPAVVIASVGRDHFLASLWRNVAGSEDHGRSGPRRVPEACPVPAVVRTTAT